MVAAREYMVAAREYMVAARVHGSNGGLDANFPPMPNCSTRNRAANESTLFPRIDCPLKLYLPMNGIRSIIPNEWNSDHPQIVYVWNAECDKNKNKQFLNWDRQLSYFQNPLLTFQNWLLLGKFSGSIVTSRIALQVSRIDRHWPSFSEWVYPFNNY